MNFILTKLYSTVACNFGSRTFGPNNWAQAFGLTYLCLKEIQEFFPRKKQLKLQLRFLSADKKRSITRIVDIVQAYKQNGFNLIHHLCEYYAHDNQIDVVKLLIENGFDETAKDFKEWTALHLLCRFHFHDNLIEFID